jgi:antitoxin (DNA-binding transcriptional repressor) of toxin-antitoxin stability system
MKTLTVTEVARNFSLVMDGVESEREEIVLIRNHKPLARLVPEPREMTALEILGDLFRTLDDGTADALADAIKTSKKWKTGTLKSLHNPRVS